MSDNTKKGWANKPTPEEYMTIATKPSPSEMQISSPPSPSEMKIEAKPSPSESTPPSTPPSKRVKLSPIIEVTAPNLKRGRTTSSALIIENARHSPGSSRRNAMSQLYRCDMTAKELMWSFPTIKFSTLRVVNMASHHSRYEGYVTSEAFEKLQEQVRAHKDSFDVIIVLFTDVLRIGAKVEHVTRLQAELAKISDKASVLTIKEAGKDLEAAGKIVQVWLKKRSDVGEDSSHVDGGKSLPRSAHGEQLNTNIKARRKELNDQTNSSGSLAPRIAAAVEIGKKFQCPTDPLTKDVYKAMVKDVDVDGSDENVAKIADQWKNHALQYETWVAGLSEKDVENLAYLRTTDSEDELSDFDDEGEVNGRHYKNGIPVHQSNGVFGAIDCIGKDRGTEISNVALLCDQRKPRTRILRDDFLKLMTILPFSKTKSVFIDAWNRPSGRLSQGKLLMKVCQQTTSKTEIISAKNIGQAKQENIPPDGSDPTWDVTALDAMEADNIRMQRNEAATKVRNESIAELPVTFAGCKLFKDMKQEQKGELSEALRGISTKKIPVAVLREENDKSLAWWQRENDEDEIWSDVEDEEDEESLGSSVWGSQSSTSDEQSSTSDEGGESGDESIEG